MSYFPELKVIPTSYQGITFRSRAEARWAVVFDELSLEYDYEPEGYKLPSGNYLPDFYIRNLGCFFEVKGVDPTHQEIVRADELAVMTRNVVILTKGPPNRKRKEWDKDLLTFIPELSFEDKWYADWHEGGLVGPRWGHHPKCSIDLGNLVHLQCSSDVCWETAYVRACNHRFGC